jgi:hypothetical protein
MRKWAYIAAAAGVLVSPPALADALVEVTNHTISVNRGQGFRQVADVTPVNPGDLVMASAAGHGWILYPDCDVEVLPGRVYTVEDRPGMVRIRDPKEVRPICKRAVPYWLLGVGAAGLAAGIAVAIGDDDDKRPPRDDDDEPASP